MNKLSFWLVAFSIWILLPVIAHAQLAGSLNMTQTNCVRTLTVSVIGGSGNYNIAWGVNNSSCTVPTNNSTSTLNAACSSDARYYVFVRDNVTNALGYFERDVPKIVTGAFSVSLANTITPNNDGFNDYFALMSAGNGTAPLNAHSYSFWVGPNPAGTGLLHSQSNSNPTGLNGGINLWQPSPSSVNSQLYYYSVTLTNCATSQEYHGWLNVIK